MKKSENVSLYSQHHLPLDPLQEIAVCPLYAVVDACLAYDFVERVQGRSGLEAKMLFKGAGTIYEEIDLVAPYLCSLLRDKGLIVEWLSRLGDNAGVLFTSESPMTALHKHLRKNFVARDSTEQDYFFRFYDPRVLRGFLPACEPKEIRAFFGPLRTIIVEDNQPGNLIGFSLNRGSLQVARFQVDELLKRLELSDWFKS
jgi:hypothetical protein